MSLDLVTLRRILADEKEACQRRVNQGVLKGDLNQSLSALGGMEVVEHLSNIFETEYSRESNAAFERRLAQRKAVRVRSIRERG